MDKVLVVNPKDNVGVVIALEGVQKDESIFYDLSGTTHTLKALTHVPRGHKIALQDIDPGMPVIKYGFPIGTAASSVRAGDHAHIHNVSMLPRDFRFPDKKDALQGSRLTQQLQETFQGFRRSNGTVGIRNYVAVMASVNCSATVVKRICEEMRKFDLPLREKNIDGFVPVVHTLGCTQVIGGSAYELLNRTLAGWTANPNIVGVLVVGLGCEGTTHKSIIEARQAYQPLADIPIAHFDIQAVGGTVKAIEQGIECLKTMVAELPIFQREACSVKHLKVALNCGGSDGYSGITANPALGAMSDLLVERGGTVVLAEIPECHGAESLLKERCQSDQMRQKLDQIFKWWTDYVNGKNISLNDNLAEGNKAGGLTTIIEKSLGALAKAGSTPLNEVLEYAELVRGPGFSIMNTPGYDPTSVTGLVAGGCNIVAFTTGRGSVYGCSIAPTLKIATNQDVFIRMADDMDFSAFSALEDGVQKTGEALYSYLIRIASGEKTKSEELSIGSEEFVPWSLGEML